MGRESDVKSLVGQRIAVGLSSVIGVTVLPGQIVAALKMFSGGTCEVGGASLTWNGGYVLTAGETINMNSSGTFYLVASGATCTLMLLRGKSAGFE